MEDTPPHLKALQLELWLAKPPEERLRITLEDNDALYALWYEVRKNNKDNDPDIPSGSPRPG